MFIPAAIGTADPERMEPGAFDSPVFRALIGMMKRFLFPLLSSLLIASAHGALVEKAVTYEQGGVKLEGFHVYDDAVKGKRPAVLIIHQWTGLTDYEKGRGRQLAELGYNVLAADIYGVGIRPKPPEAATEAGKYKGDRRLFRARIDAGLEVLKEDERITSVNDLMEYMNLLMDATTHLSGMITSILDYSRQTGTQQKAEQVDVHVLVEQIAYLLFPPKFIDIRIEGRLPEIYTQKLKLQQVFQNLISNAIKYNDKERGAIVISHEEDGEFYKFLVADNGPGILAEDQRNIFKLFATSENKTNSDSSTGVGLNIMKVLVEEQGGKIAVQSEPGKGSTFSFQWRK